MKTRLSTRNVLLIAALLLLSCFLIALVVNAYSIYRDTIIVQQEQFLLTISDSGARSITTYLDNKESELDFLAEAITSDNYGELMSDYCAPENNAVSLMALFDGEGRFVHEHRSAEAIITSAEVRAPAMTATVHGNAISRAFEAQDGSFVLIYSREIAAGDMAGHTLYMALSVQALYRQIIEPINTGVKGYTMVKNSEGTIIMHPRPEQIGIDVIDGRKELYPEFDYTDLEKLIELQLQGERGYMMYTSYWWTDTPPTPVVKLNGFCPVTVGDEFWIVATTIDYHELDLPVSKTRSSLFLFGLIVVGLLLSVAIAIYKTQRDRQFLTDKMQHLQELNAALEDLHKSQHMLTHLQKMETIGTFTSGIAHEINNLLTPILGYSEMILGDTPRGTPLFDDISEIHSASIKAKDVIDQLLLYSRRQKGSGMKRVELHTLLAQNIKLLHSFLPSDIDLKVDLDEGAGFIQANGTQISQVILNLCTNAIQAMEGGGTLTVGLKGDAAAKAVVITVQDTGVGIESEILDDIFAPFFTTKDMDKGTGLGLSIVQGIVQAHHGDISVISAPGQGSTFTVTLPRIEDAESDSEA